MALVRHGTIGDFQPGVVDWVSYTERLEQYFTANGIATDAAEQRRAILLSVCGPATYQLIRNLVAPAKPTDKTFAQLVALVKEHQQPTPSFIVQRYHFNTRVQRPGESISEFIAQLRKISEHCRYGDSLDDMLRDRLVCGCLDKRLQCKLLADPELTFAKALATAKAMETAERSAKDLHGDSTGQVHLMRRRPTRNRRSGPPKAQSQVSSTCSRCGAAHSPDSCKYKSATCHYCKNQVISQRSVERRPKTCSPPPPVRALTKWLPPTLQKSTLCTTHPLANHSPCWCPSVSTMSTCQWK